MSNFGFNEEQAGKFAIVLMIGAVIGYIIWKKNKKRGKSYRNDNDWVRIFLLYWLTFTIGFWVFTKLIPYILITSQVGKYIFGGFILEISSKIQQMIRSERKNINLDKWFFIWGLLHTFFLFVSILLINSLNIQNILVSFVSVGFSITILTHLAWKLIYN